MMTEIKRPLSLQLSSSSGNSNSMSISNPTKAVATSLPRPTMNDIVPARPRTITTTSTTNKRIAIEPRRKLTSSASSGSLTSFSSSFTTSTSTSSMNSFSPLTPTPQTTCYETPDSPSLILPYLYVGDQAQTQIDTISSLNISYILSLQSLPKFLDSDIQLEETSATTSSNNNVDVRSTSSTNNVQSGVNETITSTSATRGTIYCPKLSTSRVSKDKSHTATHHYCSPIIQRVVSDGDNKQLETQPSSNEIISEQINDEPRQSCGDDKQVVTKDLLPSMNSSKDYLVKFRSCVNRLIKGKCINVSDTFEQYVDKFFDETHNFIEEARRNKCNILVHCKAGISRSPTIAIAYLMKWKQLHLQDAYDFVKRCRPQISPNLNFMGQLMNYERRLLQRNFTKTHSLPSPITSCLLSHPSCQGQQQQKQQQQPYHEQHSSNGRPTTQPFAASHTIENNTSDKLDLSIPASGILGGEQTSGAVASSCMPNREVQFTL